MAGALLMAGGCNPTQDEPPVNYPGGSIEYLGNGSSERPLSCYQVALNTDLGDNTLRWVTGYIVGWVDTSAGDNTMNPSTAKFSFVDPQNEDAVYTPIASNIIIAPDTLTDAQLAVYTLPENTDSLKKYLKRCVPVQLPSGNMRTALNLEKKDNMHKEVSICGTIGQKYMGAPGLKEVEYYAYGPKGVWFARPSLRFFDPPQDNDFEGWSHNNGDAEVSGEVWKTDYRFGLVATGKIGDDRFAVNEATVESAPISLASIHQPVLEFQHAGNYFTTQLNMQQMCKVYIAVKDGSNWGEWQQLTIQYPEKQSWTFVPSGQIALSDFGAVEDSGVGKTVKIKLTYTSTATLCGTWEVKQFRFYNQEDLVNPNPAEPAN